MKNGLSKFLLDKVWMYCVYIYIRAYLYIYIHIWQSLCLWIRVWQCLCLWEGLCLTEYVRHRLSHRVSISEYVSVSEYVSDRDMPLLQRHRSSVSICLTESLSLNMSLSLYTSLTETYLFRHVSLVFRATYSAICLSDRVRSMRMGFFVKRFLSGGKPLYIQRFAEKYTEVKVRGTPVNFRGNLSENSGTPVKTCKLWGLQWKLVSYGDSSENLKWGVLKFSHMFPRKKTGVPRTETLVYFRQTSVCTKVCPTEKPLYKEPHSHGPDYDFSIRET